MRGREEAKPDRLFVNSRKYFRDIFVFVIVIACTISITLLHASTGGGESEGGNNWVNFGWRAFNFIVLAGLLYWMMASNVRDFFYKRQSDVKIALEGLTVAKKEAERKFAEYNAKLDKASEEIESIADIIRQQGLVEKQKIIADAEKAAAKMKEDARKRIDQEMKMARHDLRVEAVRLSVQMAQDILKKQITESDHAVIVADYIDKLVSKH